VHFLESFEVQAQVQAFIQVMPDLVKRAAEWAEILHSRIMNDAISRDVFEKALRSGDMQNQGKVVQFLAG
jgi:hypothetical protein